MTDEQIERVAKVINGPYDPTHIGQEKLRELQDHRWEHKTTKVEKRNRRIQARAALAAMPDAAAIRDAALREAAHKYYEGAMVGGGDSWDFFKSAHDAILSLIDSPTPAQPTVQQAAKVLLDAMGPSDLIDAVVMEMFWDGRPFSALRALAGDRHD